ncbi:MAG: putative efflux pump rane fusion protein, partial [Gammaproteobacteria bacterium]|nr:putative efflux pump rane fusion protein [Gammaproteobacteria bacterium]
IDLIEDQKTYSGFRWTSSQGPNLLIGNGTLATATVTIKEQAPITLIIPALKRFFGLG